MIPASFFGRFPNLKYANAAENVQAVALPFGGTSASTSCR